ncbi:hypothetical protein Tco_0028985, partial [Tanacetum coccineum]
MNYVPVTAGIISNDSAGTSEEVSQDCIVMPTWKDTSYFDSPTKDVENSEPKTADDAQKQVEDGLNNENAEQERFADDNSTKDVNVAGQHINTASPDVNTDSLKLNVVDPLVNTTNSNEQHSTEDEPEVDLGNITNSYIVPTIPNTRIHKDHPIDNVIGKVKSTVQTRRMTKPTSKQGFLSDIEPTKIAKALSDSSWVEAMQEELLDSPFELVAYTDSDYARATQDRKSTIGGCQFLGNRLISWQCKKQTVVATSIIEAEYVAAASCCGQVLWIQNQLLDYGYNFMYTIINIDNNSTICIIENPVQ